MGDSERRVSGGGSMSQTMTSERGQRTQAKTYKNYIGGRWVESKSGRTFTSTHPAHKDEVLGVMQASTADDVNLAVEAAQHAFPGWRHTPAPARGEICLKAGLIIQERKEELARLMTQEMGKVLKEARGEVQEAIERAKYAAGLGRHPHGETVPSELRNKWCMTERVPLGVVACITPWNFPMAIPSWKIFPAVMAGNAVVFKPASDTPIIATKLVEIFEEAGLPGGVLNLVTGSGSDVGDVLVRDPRVQGISFTGSTACSRTPTWGRSSMRPRSRRCTSTPISGRRSTPAWCMVAISPDPMGGSTGRRSLLTVARTCGWRRRRSSVPPHWCCPSAISTRRSTWRTPPSTAFPCRSIPTTCARPSTPWRRCSRASSMSTRPRLAPRSSCPSGV